ncbi:MAG: hypothetical protein KA498_10245 [Neisseriaceae bacterium]|nr:hypothetical protein [Neisseriaceae bacterium]
MIQLKRCLLPALLLWAVTGCAEKTRPVTAQVAISVQKEVQDLAPEIGVIQPGDQCQLGDKLHIAKVYAYRKVDCESGLSGYILNPEVGDFM